MEENNNTRLKNAKIFVRVLPLARVCDCLVKIGDNKKDIHVRCMRDMKRNKSVKNESPSVYWQFPTDGIFKNNSQDEVYREVVTQDLLNNILDGSNCVIVSYGQTGSGKSFTIAGLSNSYEHRGIISRLLSDMFEEKRIKKYSNAIEYRLSYIEIYSNKVKDLLLVEKDNKEKSKCVGDALKNVTSINITSEDEALKKIFEGEARKRIEPGDKYDGSHQGTSVLTFHVSNESLITSRAVKTDSKVYVDRIMHIVDMAGVDSVGKSKCKKSVEQVRYANLDKAQMERLIINLQKPDRLATHRHSNNLLKYLAGEFSLASILRFIAHIRPSEEDLVLTLSVLRFGSEVKKLKPRKIFRGIANSGGDFEIKKLREEIAALKQELKINDILLHQEPMESISITRAKQIEQAAADFVNGGLDDLTLVSISQAQILLKAFKNMFKKLEQEHQIALQKVTGDANDYIAKDLNKCSTLSLTKSSKSAITSNNNGKMKQRKNKSSSAVEHLSKVSTSRVSLDKNDATKEKVGELIDSGITIGPGRLEPAFGPAVKLINIKKYGVGKCRGTFTRSDNLIEESSAKLISKVKTGDNEALILFLKGNEEAIVLKNDFKEAESARKSCQQTIKELITRYKEVKTDLEISRLEFEKQRNARHFTSNESYDDRGRVIVPDSEMEWLNVVKRLEEDFSSLECRIRSAEEELKDLSDSELNAICKLELAFQNFYNDKFDERISLATILKENSSSSDRKDDAEEVDKMKSKFIEMQEMMKLMIRNRSMPKPKSTMKTNFNRFMIKRCTD